MSRTASLTCIDSAMTRLSVYS